MATTQTFFNSNLETSFTYTYNILKYFCRLLSDVVVDIIFEIKKEEKQKMRKISSSRFAQQTKYNRDTLTFKKKCNRVNQSMSFRSFLTLKFSYTIFRIVSFYNIYIHSKLL